MNNFKKTGGFTLVELIVVIAILGILAAVAVPAYSGYITKANEAADITQLDAIKTAAMATGAEKGAVTEVIVTTDDDGVVIDIDANIAGTDAALVDSTDDKIDPDFELFYGSSTMPTMKSETYADGAVWSSVAGEEVTLGGNTFDTVVGWIGAAEAADSSAS